MPMGRRPTSRRISETNSALTHSQFCCLSLICSISSMLPVEVCTLGCGEAFYVLEDRDVHDTSKCALRSTPTVKARHLTAPRQKKPVLPAVTVRLPSPPSTPDTIELQLETKIKMKRKADDDILPTRTPVKKARIMARPATLKASTRKRKVPVIETPTIKRTMAVPSLPTPPPSVATQLRFTKGVREVSDNTLPLASLKPESSCSVSFFKRTHSTDYTCTSNSTAPRRQKPYDPVRERTPTEGEIEELEITVFSRQKPHSMVGWSDAQRRAVGPTTPPSSSVGLSVSLTKSHSIGDILRAAEIIEGTSSTN